MKNREFQVFLRKCFLTIASLCETLDVKEIALAGNDTQFYKSKDEKKIDILTIFDKDDNNQNITVYDDGRYKNEDYPLLVEEQAFLKNQCKLYMERLTVMLENKIEQDQRLLESAKNLSKSLFS